VSRPTFINYQQIFREVQDKQDCVMCTAWKRDYRRYKRKLYRVQSIIIIHLTCIVYLPKQPGKQSS